MSTTGNALSTIGNALLLQARRRLFLAALGQADPTAVDAFTLIRGKVDARDMSLEQAQEYVRMRAREVMLTAGSATETGGDLDSARTLAMAALVVDLEDQYPTRG